MLVLHLLAVGLDTLPRPRTIIWASTVQILTLSTQNSAVGARFPVRGRPVGEGTMPLTGVPFAGLAIKISTRDNHYCEEET